MIFRLGTHLRTLRELIFFLIQHRLPGWGGPPTTNPTTTNPTTNRWTDKIFDLKLQYLLSSRIDKIKIKCQIPFAMFFPFVRTVLIFLNLFYFLQISLPIHTYVQIYDLIFSRFSLIFFSGYFLFYNSMVSIIHHSTYVCIN